MSSTRRAFVITPFSKKTAADGTITDFDSTYSKLLGPMITADGLIPHRPDADRRGGDPVPSRKRVWLVVGGPICAKA